MPYKAHRANYYWHCFDNECPDYVKYVDTDQMNKNIYIYSTSDKSIDDEIISFLNKNFSTFKPNRESCVAVSNFAYDLYQSCYKDA